jgi:hypothetical protein
MNVVWLECDWSGLKVRHKRSIGSPSLPSAYEWQIGVFQKRFEFVSARKSGPFAEVKWDHPPPVVTMRDEQRGFRCLGGEDRAVCWLLIQIPVYRPAAYGGGEREGGERRVAGVTTVDLEGHGEQGRRKGDAEQVRRGKTSIVQPAEEQQGGCMVLFSASEGGRPGTIYRQTNSRRSFVDSCGTITSSRQAVARRRTIKGGLLAIG